MSVPIAEVAKVASPTDGQVAPADIAVTARLHPEDEDEKGKNREQSGEGEEQEAESGGHGFY